MAGPLDLEPRRIPPVLTDAPATRVAAAADPDAFAAPLAALAGEQAGAGWAAPARTDQLPGGKSPLVLERLARDPDAPERLVYQLPKPTQRGA